MAARTTITAALLGGIRQHIIHMASYGAYKIGDAWHQSAITLAEVRANGSVLVAFDLEPQDAQLTPASAFRLCDEEDNVLAEREETIAFVPGESDAVMYRFRFGVRVGEDGEEDET